MNEHPSDADLVALTQSGDQHAMGLLLERHYDTIHAVCHRIAGASRDGDDATQEALIRIVRHIGHFDGRSAFDTWAYRVATNTSIDELRKRQRRPNIHLTTSETDQPTVEAVDYDAERAVEAVSDRLAIDDALQQLADDFRVAVVMRDVVGLEYGEIAENLGVPVGTIKSRIARGRRQLVEILFPAGNHDLTDERPTRRPPLEP